MHVDTSGRCFNTCLWPVLVDDPAPFGSQSRLSHRASAQACAHTLGIPLDGSRRATSTSGLKGATVRFVCARRACSFDVGGARTSEHLGSRTFESLARSRQQHECQSTGPADQTRLTRAPNLKTRATRLQIPGAAETRAGEARPEAPRDGQAMKPRRQQRAKQLTTGNPQGIEHNNTAGQARTDERR